MAEHLTYKGFSRATLEGFGVKFDGDRIVVPYFTTKGVMYREKVFQPTGTPRVLWQGKSKPQVPYGLETLKMGGDILFLAEGESCAWALREAYPNIPVLGLPGSQSWQKDWVKPVSGFKRVFMLFDADDAGRSLRKRVQTDLPNARNVVWPDGFDARDVLQGDGEPHHMGRAFCSASILMAEEAFLNEDAIRDEDHVDMYIRRYVFLLARSLKVLREAGVLE